VPDRILREWLGVLVWTRTERDGDGVIIGLKFAVRSPADYLVLADLMYGDAGALAKFLAKRRKHMGILRGSAAFLRWGASSRREPSHICFPAHASQAPCASSPLSVRRPRSQLSPRVRAVRAPRRPRLPTRARLGRSSKRRRFHLQPRRPA
jgi:hypothetical protein